jgi:putative tryptophan/tyrosine transport system substrate-binding protein
MMAGVEKQDARMRRRELLLFFGGAALWPLAARAQQKPMAVVGYLEPASLFAPNVAAFQQGLGETGYVEGQNLAIEYRVAESHYDRLPALVADLVGRKVNVIAAIGGVSALAAKSATSAIPVVFMGVGDPVGMGLVASLGRPGGNLTGFSNLIGELMAKRLELLSQLIPQASVFSLLVNPSNSIAERLIGIVEDAARAKGVRLEMLKASTENEIDTAFAGLAQLRTSGLLVIPDPFFANRREQFVTLASRHAVPAIYPWPPFVTAGGLISYGIDNVPVWRQAGIYVGRILKGAKPADLPVQQPTFELVVNLKTAEALGLTVPPSILARATEVIE